MGCFNANDTTLINFTGPVQLSKNSPDPIKQQIDLLSKTPPTFTQGFPSGIEIDEIQVIDEQIDGEIITLKRIVTLKSGEVGELECDDVVERIDP